MVDKCYTILFGYQSIIRMLFFNFYQSLKFFFVNDSCPLKRYLNSRPVIYNKISNVPATITIQQKSNEKL